MHNTSVLASIVLLVALLMGQAVLAGPCLVVLEDQISGAVIQDRGKEQTLSANTRLADCSQLTLKRGIIHVLYESQAGEVKRQTCKDPNTPCRIDASTGTSFLESLLKLVTYQSVPGGKKMDKDVSRLPGIPHGTVLSMDRATTFNLARAGLTQWSLTLMDADRKTPIFRKAGSDPVLRIPGNLLRPGGSILCSSTVAISDIVADSTFSVGQRRKMSPGKSDRPPMTPVPPHAPESWTSSLFYRTTLILRWNCCARS